MLTAMDLKRYEIVRVEVVRGGIIIQRRCPANDLSCKIENYLKYQ